MDKIDSLIKGLEKAIDINQTLEQVFNMSDVQALILKLNFEQLDEGKTRTGEVIKTFKSQGSAVYSPTSIIIRGALGLPTDRVTLKVSGDYRKTFRVDSENTFVEVEADEEKRNGKISDNVDTTDIYNLNNDNIEKLIDYIIPKINAINHELLGV